MKIDIVKDWVCDNWEMCLCAAIFIGTLSFFMYESDVEKAFNKKCEEACYPYYTHWGYPECICNMKKKKVEIK